MSFKLKSQALTACSHKVGDIGLDQNHTYTFEYMHQM